ncbi:MAG: hypothetical protein V4584_07660 [Verrucomicrobiota bacterium]
MNHHPMTFFGLKLPVRRFLPMLVLIAGISFDQTHWLNFSLSPVACVFALVLLPFTLTFREMVVWTVIYTLVIAISLWLRRWMWMGSSGNPEALVATRTLMVAAAGMLACLLARHREQNALIVRGIHKLLDEMQMPLVTSDCDGWLIHMNPQAVELLGDDALLGSPFFDHFSLSSSKGKSIQAYVDLATGTTSGPIPVTLSGRPDRSKTHPAIMMCVDIGERRQVLTLLYPTPQEPPPEPLASHD